MPRKYDKKTKANFRAGRRNSRRASMRINMVSPGLSMFDDEFDPSIDDTLLLLKARGVDRERKRFAEALSEVRDRISKIVDDYDAMLDETAYVYRDYVDELEGQASVMPGSKLKHNILRILADYKFVCAEREELLHALQESMTAQQSSLREVPTYFDDEDEFDFYASDTCLRNYTKTLQWFSGKFMDMDAKVSMLRRRELASKGEKKRRKKEQQKEKAKVVEQIETLEAADSKERVETWKFAAEEIVELLKNVRQEGEGGKDILSGELQKIMNIMNKQNEEIEKKTQMLQKEKKATLKMKHNRDKLQVQIGTLEDRLKAKQNEVSKCKQYIQEIVKKMKDSNGELKFSLEGMEGLDDDLQDELPTVMRRRFTLTQSSLEEDFANMKMNDAQKKTSDLQEENSKLQEEITKLGEAIVQKDKEFFELKTMFSEGVGLPCPKCLELTGTPRSEDETLTPDKDKLEMLEQKLEESESKLETTVMELARMRSSGITLPSLVNVGSQTPANLDEMANDDEADQYSSSASSLHTERTESRESSPLAEFVITEPSPCAGDSMDEAVDSPSIKTKNRRKGKRKKSTRKDHSVKQTARRSIHPDQVSGNDENQEIASERGTTEDFEDDVMQSRKTMENKAVQTIHGRSAFGRSPLHRDAGKSIPGSRSDRECIDDLRDEMASFATGKMDLETGWRVKLHKLCNNIEEILDDSETGGQLERILSAAMTGEKSDDVADYPPDFRPVEEQFAQNASRKRKSIFMRLVDNNMQKRGSIMPDVAKVQDHFGRYNRSKSVHTPQYTNIMEEPEKTLLPHLPTMSPQHPFTTSKHSVLESPDVLQSKREVQTPKSSPPKMTGAPMEKTKISSHEMQLSENQVDVPGKQTTGILKHTPPKHSELHTHPVHAPSVPSHPKEDMKGKVRKQSLTFGGEEEVNAPYSKPFRVRRRSIFGHADVLEKLASSTGLEHSGVPGESKLVEGIPYQESDRYYDDENEEYRRTISRGKSSEYATRTPTTPDRAFNAQHLRYRRMSRGNFRPSMHPFIGLSEEDRASLTNIYNTRQSVGGLFGRTMPDYNEEESEIEVGALMNNFRRDSLRKAFLSLGLMHLKGHGDDVRADERLTMEDQVNIVAQMAMEVLSATCDVFARSRKESQSIPAEQFEKADDDSYNEVVGKRSKEGMFPPVNTPENRLFFEDKPIDSTGGEDNKEISLPEIPKHAVTPEAETKDPINRTKRESLMKRPRQGSEQKQRDTFERYAAKRRSLNRSHPFRNLNKRKTVMERILGSNLNAVGNILANEPRFGGIRSHRNSLSRRPLLMDDGEEFSLTAQAIKLPGPSHQATPLISQPAGKPRVTSQGMPKSPSVSAHGLSASGGMKYAPAISKAKSDVTHNRLFVGAGGQETARWPAGRMRQPSIRKKL